MSLYKEQEYALLIALALKGEDVNLDELQRLAESAGAIVVSKMTQHGDIQSATYFGSGKLQEFHQEIANNNINLVICDNELSGSQLRNMEEVLCVKIIDRSTLILDIFALRAKSMEGKLQVELAQLKYNLPRLIGVSGRLARFGGGIGMRGPGETKLEVDKRIISKQITMLEDRLKKISTERNMRREQRLKYEKNVCLVGYTNAGKSTLLNVLARSDQFAEDKLFATLDPVTRKAHLYEDRYFLLTDTVGFISKLPHDFVKAFSSTLEETRLADLLIFVVDSSSNRIQEEMSAVREVLKSLNVTAPIFTVYNKSDIKNQGLTLCDDSMEISALTGENIERLKLTIEKKLYGDNLTRY